MRTTLAALAFALLALSATPVGVFARTEEWKRSYDLGPRPTVIVRTDDARVIVHTRPSGPVEFRVEYVFNKVGMVFRPSKSLDVRFEQQGDSVTLVAHEPRFLALFASVETRFVVDVTVPRGATLDVLTGDGTIECEALEGGGQFEATDGSVKLTDCRGPVSVRTTDGPVDVSGMHGGLTAHTRDGRMRLDGVFDQLQVSSGDGRVEVTARPGSRLVEAWSLETGDGSLEVRIPRDLAAMLDARSRGGSLRVELPIGAERPHRGELIGRLNGGGPLLRLRTGDGRLALGLAP